MARNKVARRFKAGTLEADLTLLKTKPIDADRLAKINEAREKLKTKGLYVAVSPKAKFKNITKKKKQAKPKTRKERRLKRKERPLAEKIAARKRMPYEDFLKSTYWKEVRKVVLKRDNSMCVICKDTKRLDIHHDTYKNHGDEMNHLEDLMTLCRKCHKEHHDAQN